MEASTKITFKIHNGSCYQGDIEDRLAIRLSFDLDDQPSTMLARCLTTHRSPHRAREHS